MDRLDELALLAAIIEDGSLAAAGRRLGLSAPAVTRVLAGLEQRVGGRLVERTTRRAVPTEQGLLLAERGRTLMAEYERATGRQAGAPLCGLLRVTAPVQFGCRHVSPVVCAFLDAHPGVQIELVLVDHILDLVAERLDVAVRLSALPDSSMIATSLGQVTRVLVASPAYLAQRGTPSRLADLAKHDTISRPGWFESREWRFPQGTVRIAPRLLVTEVEAQRSAAVAGRGIARLSSYQVADHLSDGSLVRLLPAMEPPPVPVHLVTPGGRFMPPKVRAFFDHAASALRAVSAIQPAGPAGPTQAEPTPSVHGRRRHGPGGTPGSGRG